MNKHTLGIIGLSLLTAIGSARAEDPLFEWFGGELADAPAENAPAIVPGDLGKLQELEFTVANPGDNPSSGQNVSIPFPAGTYAELTVACYIKPERGQAHEDIIGNKWDTDTGGFRLQKVWGRWGLDIANGNESAKEFAESTQDNLVMNQWQHIAATFKEGEVKLYKDGILVDTRVSPIKEIVFRSDSIRIGSGNGANPSLYNAFQGRLTGIYIGLTALDESEIHKLMSRGNP